MRLEPQQGIYATTEWLADVSGAHRTTVERWKRSQQLPRPVALLLRIMQYGELELVHPVWHQWRVDRRTGELWMPAGRWSFTPGTLLAVPYRMQQIDALERELLATRRRAQNLKQAGLFRRFLEKSHIALK
jgi:hypothetical protein